MSEQGGGGRCRCLRVDKQVITHHNPKKKKKKKVSLGVTKNVPPWQLQPKCSWGWQFIKADILTIRLTAPINWEISAAPLLSFPAQLLSPIPSHMPFSVISRFLSFLPIHRGTDHSNYFIHFISNRANSRPTSAFSPSPSYIRRVSGGLNVDLSTIPPFSHSIGAFFPSFHLLICACVAFIYCLLLPSPPGGYQHVDQHVRVNGLCEAKTEDLWGESARAANINQRAVKMWVPESLQCPRGWLDKTVEDIIISRQTGLNLWVWG